MESPTSMYNQWTSTVTEFDVIATRGVGQNKNPGNLLFRDLVAARKSQYEKNANPEFRRNLGEEIVAAIKPGRFLKKDDITQTMYKIMDHSSAVTKAMFVIRDLKTPNSVSDTNPTALTSNTESSTQSTHLNEENSSNMNTAPRIKRKYKRRENTNLQGAKDNTADLAEPTSSPLTEFVWKPFNISSKLSKRNAHSVVETPNCNESSVGDLESRVSSKVISPTKKRLKSTNTPSRSMERLRPNLLCKPIDASTYIDDNSEVIIPFRSYGYPIGVYVSKLKPLQDLQQDLTESQPLSTVQLTDSDKCILDNLIQLKHLKTDPL